MPYNETLLYDWTEMPKTAFQKKLEKFSPSNMDDEAKATFKRRVQITCAFLCGVFTTITILNGIDYYKNIPDVDFIEDENDES